MWFMLLLSLIPPLGALAADRIDWLKKRPYAQGGLFGLLILIVHVVTQKTPNSYDFVGVLDALIMVAGFFFGVIPVCVTGAIAAAVYVISNDLFWLGGLSVFVVDVLYSILSRKYYFNNERPSILPAVLFFAFGELINTIAFFLTEFNNPDFAIETTVISFGPMLLEISLGAILTSIVCRSVGNLKTNLLNYKVVAMIFLSSICFSIFFMASWAARAKSA